MPGHQNCVSVQRVVSLDVERFLSFRAGGLTSNAESFRVGCEDDRVLGRDYWRERLGRDYVVAAVSDNDAWIGIGGFLRLVGHRLMHKGLIWGMFVTEEARGLGAADAIMDALVAHARTHVRQLQLTVMGDNSRAIAFYERHGFRRYGIEPDSVRLGDAYADEALMWRIVGVVDP